MIVRSATPGDGPAWLEMRNALWPGSPHDHEREIEAYFADRSISVVCLVAEAPDGPVIGLAEVGLRPNAEGCRTSPVGYLEGIFVLPTHRGSGVGRGLVTAGERWAAERGCIEMASDRELSNEPSQAFHTAIGFEEVERIVCFRKPIRKRETA